jgi:hypothetical protein
MHDAAVAVAALAGEVIAVGVELAVSSRVN